MFKKITNLKSKLFFLFMFFLIVTLIFMNKTLDKSKNKLDEANATPLNTTTSIPTTISPATTKPIEIVNKEVDWDNLRAKFEGVSLNISTDDANSTTGLYPIIENDLKGFINSKGDVIVECIFDEIFEINDLMFGSIYKDIDEVNKILNLYFIKTSGEYENILSIEVKKNESKTFEELEELLKNAKLKVNDGENIFFLNEISNENNIYFVIIIDDIKKKYFDYNTATKELLEANEHEKIIYHETIDRNICMNLLGEYWLEDKMSNKISDIYNGFVAEKSIDKNDSPNTYLFIKKLETSQLYLKYFRLILIDKEGFVILNSEDIEKKDTEINSWNLTSIYYQKYFDIIHTEKYILYKTEIYLEKKSYSYIGRPLREKGENYSETKFINKDLLNKNNKKFHSSIIYFNESDNIMVEKEHDSQFKIIDLNFNLIFNFKVGSIDSFTPLYKNDKIVMYLVISKYKIDILDEKLELITTLLYENEKNEHFDWGLDYSYHKINDTTRYYINNNLMYYKNESLYTGLALSTLNNHDIRLVDYLFFSVRDKKRDYIYDDSKNIIGVTDEREINKTLLYPYNYGVYDLKNKTTTFLSDNYLRFYSEDMIRTSDWSYTNIKGDKIYKDQSILNDATKTQSDKDISETTKFKTIANKKVDWDNLRVKFEGVSLNSSTDDANSTTGLYPIIKDDLKGFINSKGDVIVECIFDEIFEINDLLLGVTYKDVYANFKTLTLYFIEPNGTYHEILQIDVNKIKSETFKEFEEMLKSSNFKLNNGKNIFFLNEISNKYNLYFGIIIDNNNKKYFDYNISTKELLEANEQEKIIYHETVDRNVCMNLSGEYWLEDKMSNKISDIYNGFVPEEYVNDKNNSPDTYLFIKNPEPENESLYIKYFKLILIDKEGNFISNCEDPYKEELYNYSETIKTVAYYKRYSDIINTKKYIIYKAEIYSEASPHYFKAAPSRLNGSNYSEVIFINKDLINKNDKRFYESIIYFNELDNIIVTGKVGYGDKISKLLDLDSNLISTFDTNLNSVMPLYKNDKVVMYLGISNEKVYIFDENLKSLATFFYENEKSEYFNWKVDNFYYKINNQMRYYLNMNIIANMDLTGNTYTINSLQAGVALSTLNNHGIRLVDYLFFSNLDTERDYIYDDAKEILGETSEREKNQTLLFAYNYGVYDLKNKTNTFLSDNYLRFYNKDMIRTSDWSYTNIKGDKIYKDQSIK